MEENTIDEIKIKYSEIKKFPIESHPSGISRLINDLLQLIFKLKEEETNEELKARYGIALSKLNHTSDKELEFALESYKKSKKKGAAKKRVSEYERDLEKLKMQVRLDLIGIINTI